MVPKPELNQILGGIIAKYQAEYSIELFSVIVLSNHYHMLARGPEGAIPRFFESVNREIAHRVNRYLNRKGYFWQRRYDDLLVLEDADVIEALLYTLSNNVKHTLGSHPRHWPGISSYAQCLGAKDKEYPFLHYTAYHQAKRKAERRGEWVRKSDYESIHRLQISPISLLPGLQDLDTQSLNTLLESRTRKLLKEHAAAGRAIMSRKAVLNQRTQGVFPAKSNRSPRPVCYTRNPRALAQYATERRTLRAAYTDASIKYRSGQLTTLFPSYTFRPPTHHHPKTLIPQ